MGIKMKKIKRKTTLLIKGRGKSKHVLAAMLKILGKRQKSDCESVFGYSRWTVKKIIAGKLPLSLRAAERISKLTNVAIEWLMAGNGEVPAVTMDGKPFTQKSYMEFQINRDKIKTLVVNRPTAAGLFPFLIIRAARLMTAAEADGKTIETFYKLREAINSLGTDFPKFAKPGHDFEMYFVSKITNPKQPVKVRKIFDLLHEAEKETFGKDN
jgi:hypothetical protein